ncbi:hypothetical protein [Solirubrum puertoriconensis]|uniref:Uncharacterized protein n=1 Tax=Solirubrum puertoriconensis TaxID=1751427 RepID=A0A9X0L3Z3_SOLP1|nr:hypothetical protein [Solirubrum puertoriconensis]KUG06874.1 hypothetical protein ASU33_05995 [Solirubrum puertoriconensis]
MKTLLTRLFVTNWKTTAAGVLLLFFGVAFWQGKLTAGEMISVLTVLGGAIGILSKDGARTETTVAREDVPPLEPPAGTAVLLVLLLSIGALACTDQRTAQLTRQQQQLDSLRADNRALQAWIANNDTIHRARLAGHQAQRDYETIRRTPAAGLSDDSLAGFLANPYGR